MEIQEISADCHWQYDGRAWGRVHVRPWWINEHEKLNYWNESFNDPQQEKAWREIGFEQPYFTGDLYDMRQAKPSWLNPFDNLISLTYLSWCVYRMHPGRVLPWHSDTYSNFKKIYGVKNNDTVVRLIFFLENWQSGHYFEIESNPIVDWRAGDGVYWAGSAQHVAGNLGHTSRYTLQLTGVYKHF